MRRTQDRDDWIEVRHNERACQTEEDHRGRPPQLGERVAQRNRQTAGPDLVDALGNLHVRRESDREQQATDERTRVPTQEWPAAHSLFTGTPGPPASPTTNTNR